MKLQRLLVALIVCVTCISCADRKEAGILRDVDTYIQDRPDSALKVIESIDTSRLVSNSVKAHYSLLYSMALDKNWIDTTTTDVIMPAVNYYLRHGTSDEKLKSLYYLGRVQYNAKDYNKAILTYSEALKYVSNTSDVKYSAFVNAGMADTYAMTYNYAEESVYLDEAIRLYEKLGDSSLIYIGKYRKAQNLANIKAWSSADSLFSILVKDTLISKDLRYCAFGDYGLMLVLKSSAGADKALQMFSKALELGGKLENSKLWCAYAYALAACGRKSGSEEVFNRLADSGYAESIEYNYWQYRVSILEGDYYRACVQLKASLLQNDSIMSAAYSHSAIRAQKEYFELQNRNDSLKLKSDHLVIALISTLSLLVLSIAGYFIFKRKKDYESEIERISQLLEAAENERQSDVSIAQLKKNRFAYLGKLYELVHYAGEEGTEQSQSKVYEDVRKILKDIKADSKSERRFEKMLDDEFNGIMTHYREDFPDMKDDDYRLASYVFAGFDNTVMCLLLSSSSTNAIRIRKSRMKKMISESSSARKPSYLDFLAAE